MQSGDRSEIASEDKQSSYIFYYEAGRTYSKPIWSLPGSLDNMKKYLLSWKDHEESYDYGYCFMRERIFLLHLSDKDYKSDMNFRRLDDFIKSREGLDEAFSKSLLDMSTVDKNDESSLTLAIALGDANQRVNAYQWRAELYFDRFKKSSDPMSLQRAILDYYFAWEINPKNKNTISGIKHIFSYLLVKQHNLRIFFTDYQKIIFNVFYRLNAFSCYDNLIKMDPRCHVFFKAKVALEHYKKHNAYVEALQFEDRHRIDLAIPKYIECMNAYPAAYDRVLKLFSRLYQNTEGLITYNTIEYNTLLETPKETIFAWIKRIQPIEKQIFLLLCCLDRKTGIGTRFWAADWGGMREARLDRDVLGEIVEYLVKINSELKKIIEDRDRLFEINEVMLEDKGRNIKALKNYQLATLLYPENPLAHQKMFISCLRNSLGAQADIHFKKAIQYGIEAFEMYLTRAKIHLELKNYAEALADLAEAKEENPEVAYQQWPEWDAAIKYLEQQLQINKIWHDDVLLMLGEIYFIKEEYQVAKTYFENIVNNADYSFFDSQYFLARAAHYLLNIAILEQDYQQACDHFLFALEHYQIASRKKSHVEEVQQYMLQLFKLLSKEEQLLEKLPANIMIANAFEMLLSIEIDAIHFIQCFNPETILGKRMGAMPGQTLETLNDELKQLYEKIVRLDDHFTMAIAQFILQPEVKVIEAVEKIEPKEIESVKENNPENKQPFFIFYYEHEGSRWSLLCKELDEIKTCLLFWKKSNDLRNIRCTARERIFLLHLSKEDYEEQYMGRRDREGNRISREGKLDDFLKSREGLSEEFSKSLLDVSTVDKHNEDSLTLAIALGDDDQRCNAYQWRAAYYFNRFKESPNHLFLSYAILDSYFAWEMKPKDKTITNGIKNIISYLLMKEQSNKNNVSSNFDFLEITRVFSNLADLGYYDNLIQMDPRCHVLFSASVVLNHFKDNDAYATALKFEYQLRIDLAIPAYIECMKAYPFAYDRVLRIFNELYQDPKRSSTGYARTYKAILEIPKETIFSWIKTIQPIEKQIPLLLCCLNRKTRIGERFWAADWGGVVDARLDRGVLADIVAYLTQINPVCMQLTSHKQRKISQKLLKGEEEALKSWSLNDYQLAALLFPDNAEIHKKIFILLSKNLQWNDADIHFKKAIQYGIEPSIMYLARAKIYIEQKNYAGALADFAEAKEADPQNEAVYIQAALLNASLNKEEDAIADYTRAIALCIQNKNPNQLTLVYRRRGEIYQKLKEWDKAIADWKQVEQSVDKENRLHASRVLGEIYFINEKYKTAKRYCEKVTKAKNSSTDFDSARAWHCLLEMDIIMAKKSFPLEKGGELYAAYLKFLLALIYYQKAEIKRNHVEECHQSMLRLFKLLNEDERLLAEFPADKLIIQEFEMLLSVEAYVIHFIQCFNPETNLGKRMGAKSEQTLETLSEELKQLYQKIVRLDPNYKMAITQFVVLPEMKIETASDENKSTTIYSSNGPTAFAVQLTPQQIQALNMAQQRREKKQDEQSNAMYGL